MYLHPNLIFSNNTTGISLFLDLKNDTKTIADVTQIAELFYREDIPIDDWGLFEYPIEGCYCFYNKKENQYVAFANYFTEDNTFVPTYLDNNSNEQQATSIREAIRRE